MRGIRSTSLLPAPQNFNWGLLLAGLDVCVCSQSERVSERNMVEAMNRLVGMYRDTERYYLTLGERQITFTAA